MTIDPQKEALYAEITRRAGLYTHMLLLQRNGAPMEQIDAAIAAIGQCEAEIRRMSDEVNDRIWYANYGGLLRLIEEQGQARDRQHQELLAALAEGRRGLKKLDGRVARLERQMQESQDDRADLRRLVEDIIRRFDEYIAAVPIARRDELVRAIEAHEVWIKAHGDVH